MIGISLRETTETQSHERIKKSKIESKKQKQILGNALLVRENGPSFIKRPAVVNLHLKGVDELYEPPPKRDSKIDRSISNSFIY